MSIWSKLGKIQVGHILGSAIEEGVVSGIQESYKATEPGYDRTLSENPLYSNYTDQSINEEYGSGMVNASRNYSDMTLVENKDINSKLWELPVQNYMTGASQTFNTKLPDRGTAGVNDIYELELPDWGYADFINERALFQKRVGHILNDPGWFYFKVFFKFDTDHGLFGGMFTESPANSINSAGKYLWICRNQYRQEKLLDRLHALEKFTSLLSNTVTMTPWLFTEVKGLDNASKPIMEKFSEEKSIEIGLSNDTIEQRLINMMSLYLYACYDNATSKEIIPENLRKFDMSVVLFAAPIKKFHTAIYDKKNNKKFPYKKLNPESGSYDNVMSFKIYEFKNCEFDAASFAGVISGSVKNEAPFELGGNSLKIKYDRVYEHTMNEFNRMMFGTNGFYYSDYTKFKSLRPKESDVAYVPDNSGVMYSRPSYRDRYNAIASVFDDIVTSGYNNTNLKRLVDASEALIHSRLAPLTAGRYSIGNIYGQETAIASKYKLSTTNDTPMQVDSSGYNDYFVSKMKYLKDKYNATIFEKRAVNWLINKLFNDRYPVMSQVEKNLYGLYGEFKKKLRQGTYDPDMLYMALREDDISNAQRGVLDADRNASWLYGDFAERVDGSKDKKELGRDFMVNGLNPFIIDRKTDNGNYATLKEILLKDLRASQNNKQSLDDKLGMLFDVLNKTRGDLGLHISLAGIMNRMSESTKNFAVNSGNDSTSSPIWTSNYSIEKSRFINWMKNAGLKLDTSKGLHPLQNTSMASIIESFVNAMNKNNPPLLSINQETVQKRQFNVREWIVNSMYNTTLYGDNTNLKDSVYGYAFPGSSMQQSNIAQNQHYNYGMTEGSSWLSPTGNDVNRTGKQPLKYEKPGSPATQRSGKTYIENPMPGGAIQVQNFKALKGRDINSLFHLKS